MPQRPKKQIRSAVLAATREQLATAGIDGTTLATVASRAGTSIGNLYRYFASKDDLVSAAMPAELVAELGRLLRGRVEALGVERDASTLPPTHPYRAASTQLVRFALEHRPLILFLLRRAEGTRHAPVARGLLRELEVLATRYARAAYPKLRMTAARRRSLRRIYRAFLGSLAAILAEETTGRAREEAIGQITAYHLAGLRAFFRSACETAAQGTP